MSNIDVEIVEVGPRDGLQNESRQVPTADKIKFIDALVALLTPERAVTPAALGVLS